jgi:hypothetical protein
MRKEKRRKEEIKSKRIENKRKRKFAVFKKSPCLLVKLFDNEEKTISVNQELLNCLVT